MGSRFKGPFLKRCAFEPSVQSGRRPSGSSVQASDTQGQFGSAKMGRLVQLKSFGINESRFGMSVVLDLPMNDQDLPEEGFLDDDFARFRAQRLKKAPDERAEPPAELFFGTTQRERGRIRAEEAWERESSQSGDLASLVEEEWEEPRQRAPAPPLPPRPATRARLANPGLGRKAATRPRAS